MNDFDDDRLRDEFDRRAGGDVSIAAAHDAVLARAGQVRRRRAAIAGTGALVALVVGGLVLIPRGGGDSLAPADSRLPLPAVEDVPDTTVARTATDGVNADPTTTTEPSTSTSVVPAIPPSVVASDRSTTTAMGGSATTTSPGATPTTRPTAPPAPTTSGGTVTTATTSGSGSTVTTTATTSSSTASSPTSSVPSTTNPSVAPFTRTYDSAGGSITVDWDGDSFTLLSVAPAAGFSSEIEDQQATRIRVRFSGDSDDSRIEVRVNNGQLIVDIS